MAFQKLSSLFTDEQMKKDAQHIDTTLDKVSDVVGNIINAGKATNQVIVEQTNQIKRLEGMTDSATEKMKNLGERMDKQG
jgi:methyl-accepting chemotaxis protein